MKFRFFGKQSKGFTLVEVMAVVAVGATLASGVSPIVFDQINEAKIARARVDVQVIGTGLGLMYINSGYFGSWNSKISSTPAQNLTYLRSGSGAAVDLGGHPQDPKADLWTGAAPSRTTDFLEYQLETGFPGGGSSCYRSFGVNWKGPYASGLEKCDPWGRNYVAFVWAMYTPTTGSNRGAGSGGQKYYGWVLSAGPNGVIDTPVTSSRLQGDDVGYILAAPEQGV